MNKSRAKGTTAETAVVNRLNEKGIPAKRNPLTGALDKGDITLFGNLITIEVKNEQRMTLSEYVDEAEKESRNAGSWLGVAWHKRRGKGSPDDWYVSMTGRQFIKILREIQEQREDAVN